MIFFKNRSSTLSIKDRNNRYFVWEGAIGAIVISLVTPFIIMFGKRMGAGDYEIGLLSSLPALVGILALLPGSILVDRRSDKKKIVALLALIAGFIYPLAAVTPYLGASRVMIYMLVIALLNWPLSVYNISWQSFFSDVCAPEMRNATFTNRSKAATLLGTITMLLAGIILAYIPRSDEQRILIYQLFFLIAFILTLLQIWYLMKIHDYPVVLVEKKRISLGMFMGLLKPLWANKPFRQFVIVVFLFYTTWQMAWPLFFIYQVNYLHADEAWLSYFTVANGVVGVFMFSFWGRMIEKKGARWVAIIGAFFLAINPIAQVLCQNLYQTLAINIIMGLTFVSFNLALFQSLLEVLPSENKTLYIALYTTMISISGFIMPLVGVWIYRMTNIYFVMYLDGVLRLMGTGLFLMRYLQERKQG